MLMHYILLLGSC